MSDPTKPAPRPPQLPTVVILPQPIEHMTFELVLRGETQYAHSITNKIVHAFVPTIEQRHEWLNSSAGEVLVSQPVIWAVCSQGGDQVVAQLTQTLESVRSTARQEFEKSDAARVRLKELEKANRTLTDSEGAAVARSNALSSQLTSETVRLRKLEGDLAKVRAHFGQKAFDEALSK